MSSAVTAVAGPSFPYGTLTVNIVGSLAMGVCFVLFVERGGVPEEVRLGVMTGVLGAFTTYSTFSLETVIALQAGNMLVAAANVVLSALTCVLVCWAGIAITRGVVAV